MKMLLNRQGFKCKYQVIQRGKSGISPAGHLGELGAQTWSVAQL